MRHFSKLAALAALASIASAGDAPVVKGNKLDLTYAATIPETSAGVLSGAMKIASAPDGEGVNIQFALYNLPNNTGDLSYGLYTGNVASGGDCSNTGSLLNPYDGITGTKCKSDPASCQIGDLSDAYGAIKILSGGSGTGYFSATYIDKYLSMTSGSEAFFGKGSLVIKDSTGADVACANFVNAEDAGPSSKKAAAQATKTTAGQASASANGGKGSGAGSSTTSGGMAPRTAAPLIGAGVLGLAALVL